MLTILFLLFLSILKFLTPASRTPVIATIRLSTNKCQEYGRAVFEQQTSPILSKYTKTHQISRCAIESVPLIVGGKKAKPREFPHMALIGYGNSSKNVKYWYCGGSLISSDFILTAAHCLSSQRGAPQKVKLGMVNLSVSDEYVQERNVVQRIQHPFYDSMAKINDIALLKLDRDVDFTAYVRPACLNTKEIPINSQLIATGFGKLSYESNVGSKNLMKVELTVYNQDRCKYLSMNEVKPAMLCAGEIAGGRDTCQGDSGGPLQFVLNEPYCMYSIVGVTSYGRFCGFPNSPALYTDVRFYLKWIEHLVWEKID